MSHADNTHDTSSLDHDPTSKLPSKSSQPPIAMDTKKLDQQKADIKPSIWDSDGRIYLAKYYRTQLTTGPAAFLSVLAMSPAENLKTRMQSKHFVSTLDCAKYTLRTEGFRGFWAGTLAPLVTLTATRVTGFSIYQKAKYWIDNVMERSIGVSPLNHVNMPGTYPTIYTNFTFVTSGAISGAVMSLVMTPVELVKTVQQTSVLLASDKPKSVGRIGPNQTMGTSQATKQVIQRHGIMGLYTGFQYHLMRDTVGSAIYFGVYEAVKQSMTSYWGISEANSPGPVALAGAVCGLVSWGATYPLDTFKTRVHGQLLHTTRGDPQLATLKRMASAGAPTTTSVVGGSSGLAKAAAEATKTASASSWKGIEMMLLRSSVQNAIQMLIFETLKRKIMALEFSTGTRDLPKMRREPGRDRKVF